MLNQDHYHFIGLGGIGMSGIALVLLNKGLSISGSDILEIPDPQRRRIESLSNINTVSIYQAPSIIDTIDIQL